MADRQPRRADPARRLSPPLGGARTDARQLVATRLQGGADPRVRASVGAPRGADATRDGRAAR